jgi:hypothetical protein
MEVGGQLHAPDSLPIVQETRWAPGRFRLVRKISPPPGLDPWTVQPLSRYTKDAIPAHKLGGLETQSKDCFPGWHHIVWYKFNDDAWEWAISVFRFSKLLPDWMMSNSRKQNLYLSQKNHKSQKKDKINVIIAQITKNNWQYHENFLPRSTTGTEPRLSVEWQTLSDKYGGQLIYRVLISPYPDLLPDAFCLMVRIFRLMLVLLYM